MAKRNIHEQAICVKRSDRPAAPNFMAIQGRDTLRQVFERPSA